MIATPILASGTSVKTLAAFSARDNQPPATAFATLDTRNSIAVLDFDAATDEAAILTLATSAANGTSGIVTVAEITATAIDSLVVGDTFRIKVFRDADDATNDTMTGDAELIAVEVQQIA